MRQCWLGRSGHSRNKQCILSFLHGLLEPGLQKLCGHREMTAKRERMSLEIQTMQGDCVSGRGLGQLLNVEMLLVAHSDTVALGATEIYQILQRIES